MSTSKPATRSELQEFCLRKLGKGAVNINVTTDQIEDRTVEALQYFQEYHFEGSEKVYIPKQISATTLTFAAAASGTFTGGETVTGGTSSATGIVIDAPSTTTLRIASPVGTFVADELITGGTSGETATTNGEWLMTFSSAITNTFVDDETITGNVSGATAIFIELISSTTIKVKTISGTFTVADTNVAGATAFAPWASNTALTYYTLGDIDNKYFTMDEELISVLGIFELGSTFGVNFTSDEYQFRLTELYSFLSGSSNLQDYVIRQQNLALYQEILEGKKLVRYQRHTNKLYVDWDWANDAVVDKYILVEAWQIIDESVYSDVYNDSFLKDYLTALIGENWGTNLEKFGDIQLPGGVTLNGESIRTKYSDERIKLEEEMENRYSLPVDFFVG